jgi:hypothetical protein
MRYYEIYIPGAPAAFPPLPGSGAIWSSFINGHHNPEAQQIDFSIEETTFAPIPSPSSTLTIHGVSFEQIKQSASLNGLSIYIYGGMSAGLPIATAQAPQAGLIMQGVILKCWGNWIGTEMSIGMSFVAAGLAIGQDAAGQEGVVGGGGGSASPAPLNLNLTNTPLISRSFNGVGFRSLDQLALPTAVVSPGGGQVAGAISGLVSVGGKIIGNLPLINYGDGSSTMGGITSSLFGGGGGGLTLIKPLNLIHNMAPNEPLSAAIQKTLSTAFPSASINIKISPNLMLAYQDAGVYQNMEQYAHYIQQLSNSILGTNNYAGVQMTSYNNTINVWDATQPDTAGSINPWDLIGQPTWIDIIKINVKTVLRADIHVSQTFTLPAGTLIGMTSDAVIPMTPEQKTSLSFSGLFFVTKILHIGDFRNPDGASWCTNYEAIIFSEGVAGPSQSDWQPATPAAVAGQVSYG